MLRESLLLATTFVVSTAGLANAQTREELDRPTLRGLSAVAVELPAENLQLNGTGLDATTLRTDIELRLRRSGVRVLSLEDANGTPSAGVLVVLASALHNIALNLWVLDVVVEVRQSVFLERDPSIGTVTATWRSTGVVGWTTHPLEVREQVANQVDQFINAFLSVNGR